MLHWSKFTVWVCVVGGGGGGMSAMLVKIYIADVCDLG